MAFSKKRFFLILFIFFLPFLFYFCLAPFLPEILSIANKAYTKHFVYNTTSVINSIKTAPEEGLPKKSVDTPAVIKAIYMTGWSAGSKNYLNYLDGLFKTTQINPVVIDIKDASGVISYKTNAKKAKEYKAYWPEISDINALVENLHRQGIYVIGRIVVFEDPLLAKNRPDLAVYDKSKTQDKASPVLWEDNKGLAWVDPSSQEVYDYNIEIAKDIERYGFDEINFEYGRLPTDGNADNMGFPLWNKEVPKHVVIKTFFKKLRQSLPDIKISIDLFGQTTTNIDDMGIGQVFEDSLDYFDYICPMIYPSHYAKGTFGYQTPADYPYQIIIRALDSALARQKVYYALQEVKNKNGNGTNLPSADEGLTVKAKIRPWLQDFNLGATYDASMVKKEIQAVTDSMKADFNGYMLWNASNIYTADAIAKLVDQTFE